MKRFKLIRWEGKPTGHIASGVEFEDGTCIIRWRTLIRSTGLYNSWEDMMVIHGHGIKTVCHWIDDPPESWDRAGMDYHQDRCENIAFASVGGKEARPNLVAPSYIDDRLMYLNGYVCAAITDLGLDWATCKFGWKHVLTINPDGEVEVVP
jgi:hypothetical protein